MPFREGGNRIRWVKGASVWEVGQAPAWVVPDCVLEGRSIRTRAFMCVLVSCMEHWVDDGIIQ